MFSLLMSTPLMLKCTTIIQYWLKFVVSSDARQN